MGRVYTGRKGRAIGAAGGLLMLTTGVGIYLFMGATASNVPLPDVLESGIYWLVPALAGIDERMPLLLVLVFGGTSLVLTAIGLRNTLAALRTDEYAVRVT